MRMDLTHRQVTGTRPSGVPRRSGTAIPHWEESGIRYESARLLSLMSDYGALVNRYTAVEFGCTATYLPIFNYQKDHAKDIRKYSCHEM